MTQTFQDLSTQHFADLSVFPGRSWVVLAEPARLGAMGEFEGHNLT